MEAQINLLSMSGFEARIFQTSSRLFLYFSGCTFLNVLQRILLPRLKISQVSSYKKNEYNSIPEARTEYWVFVGPVPVSSDGLGPEQQA